MTLISKAVSDAFWLACGQMSYAVGLVALVKLLSSHLALSQFGELSLILTIVTLASQSVLGSIGQGIGRFYLISIEQRDFIGFSRAAFRAYISGTLFILMLGVAGISIFYYYFSYDPKNLIIVLLYSVVACCCDVLNGLHNLAKNRMFWFVGVGIDVWLRIILIISFFKIFNPSVFLALLGYLISSIFILVFHVIVSNRLNIRFSNNYTSVNSSVNSDWNSLIFGFSWPFMLWGVFAWVQQSSDRWSLNFFGSLDQVGAYSALFQLGYTPMVMLGGLVMSYFSPRLYRSVEFNNGSNSLDGLISRLLLFGMTLLCISFVSSFFVKEYILRFILPENYTDYFYVFPFFVMSGGFFAISQVFSAKLLAGLLQRKLMSIKIVSSIVSVVLNFICGFFFDLPGVVFAVVLFNVFLLLLLCWGARVIPPYKRGRQR